tara:strand:+ start:80 stop:496 length:417 start_codon:yes stop_codon:yes gene_type:complete
MDLIQELLENVESSELSDTNYGMIKSDINDILQKIHYKDIKDGLKRLKNYRFCSDINDLRIGRYIRYISLEQKKGDNLVIKNGGIIINIKKSKNDILIICRGIAKNMFFSLKFSSNIIFQKLTDDEIIILDTIKYMDL